MEAGLGTRLDPPRPPGWGRTAGALVLGAAIGFGILLVAFLVLGAFAGVAPGGVAGDHGWPFAPDGAAAVVADLGVAAVALAMLTVVSGWTLNAWIDEPAAPTWV